MLNELNNHKLPFQAEQGLGSKVAFVLF